MSRPNALTQLLDDLRADNGGTTVVTIHKSFAIITLPGEREDIVLTPEECELLFDSEDTVIQLAEALGSPSDATIELSNVSVEDEILDALNEAFSSVDQG